MIRGVINKRIGVAGFSIESCTFSPLLSRETDFQVLRGRYLLEAHSFLADLGVEELVPLLRARALPGGPVEPGFYRTIRDETVRLLRCHGPLDGLLLILHGAANVQGMDDAEADYLGAVREAVGPDCLISASYDLHGNLSSLAMEHLDLLTAYRTAPHVDGPETVCRAGRLLLTCLERGIRPHKAYRAVPVLLSGEMTGTGWEPGAGLYRKIPDVIDGEAVMDASILIGYAWADEPRATASVTAFGQDATAVQSAVTELARAFWDNRREFGFGTPAGPVDDCIRWAMASEERPVLISDAGDNPTAGAAGDVPFVLERLLALGAEEATCASIADPVAVAACLEAGQGAMVDLELGGKLDPIHGTPLPVRGRVLRLIRGSEPPAGLAIGDGRNAQAVIRVGGVEVILTERRTSFLDPSAFERLGIDPAARRIVVVKLGYLEPGLARLARRSYLALSPGAVAPEITRIPFVRQRRPMFPFDPEMVWTP